MVSHELRAPPGVIRGWSKPLREGGAGGGGHQGLGLSTARQIIEARGGTVVAESPGAGHGAASRVRPPLAPAVDQLPPRGTVTW
ncbi:MAG TPA: hypothetical protein VF586_10495 [Pyrinomonadaceae bacterium]